MSAATWVERFAADVQARHPGVLLDLARDVAGNVVLSRVVVPADLRGHGIGEQVMAELLVQADQHEATVALTPSPDFGGDVHQLERWYRRLGFRPNRGRSRDFSTREAMIRPPGREMER